VKVLASTIFVAECYLLATVFTRRVVSGRIREDTDVGHLLTWVTAVFVIFFAAFHILGYINLATALPLVSPVLAAMLAAAALIACGVRSFWMPQVDFTFGKILRPLTGTGLEPKSAWDRNCGLAAFATFVVVAILVTRGFPRGYEATAYHLPIALHTFQSHSLRLWDTVAIHAYPANASIYFGFLLGFFRKTWFRLEISFFCPHCLRPYTGSAEQSELTMAPPAGRV